MHWKPSFCAVRRKDFHWFFHLISFLQFSTHAMNAGIREFSISILSCEQSVGEIQWSYCQDFFSLGYSVDALIKFSWVRRLWQTSTSIRVTRTFCVSSARIQIEEVSSVFCDFECWKLEKLLLPFNRGIWISMDSATS